MKTKLISVVAVAVFMFVCGAMAASAAAVLTDEKASVVRGGCTWYCTVGQTCGIWSPPDACGGSCPNGVSQCHESAKEGQPNVDGCGSQFATPWGTCDPYANLQGCGYIFSCVCEGTGENAVCATTDNQIDTQDTWSMCFIAKVTSNKNYVVAAFSD